MILTHGFIVTKAAGYEQATTSSLEFTIPGIVLAPKHAAVNPLAQLVVGMWLVAVRGVRGAADGDVLETEESAHVRLKLDSFGPLVPAHELIAVSGHLLAIVEMCELLPEVVHLVVLGVVGVLPFFLCTCLQRWMWTLDAVIATSALVVVAWSVVRLRCEAGLRGVVSGGIGGSGNGTEPMLVGMVEGALQSLNECSDVRCGTSGLYSALRSCGWRWWGWGW